MKWIEIANVYSGSEMKRYETYFENTEETQYIFSDRWLEMLRFNDSE